jgi:hypothetical protein
MFDVPDPIAKGDQRLLNTITKRVELEGELNQKLDCMQLLALKEVIAEFEAQNQRREAIALSRHVFWQSLARDGESQDRAA